MTTTKPTPLQALVQRLFSARAMMAPHQRERDNGKLILDCCEAVGGAVLSIAHLEVYLENGARIAKQDGQWHLFASDGNSLKSRDTLEGLLTDLPPAPNTDQKPGANTPRLELPQELARRIAQSLLTNGFGEVGTRLDIKREIVGGFSPKTERSLGGWCFESVVNQIAKALETK